MAHVRDRLSLRALLFLLAAVGLACVLAAAVGVGWRATQVLRETDRVVQVYDPAAEDVATLSLATSDMERGLTLYVLTGVEDDLRPYVDGERRSALALNSLQRLVGDDPEIAPLLQAAGDQPDRLDQPDRPAGDPEDACRQAGGRRAARHQRPGDSPV